MLNADRRFGPPDDRHLGYRPSLDGLRALAIVLVAVYHFSGSRWPVAGGWLGVNLFFLISGYLITRLLLEEISRTGTIDLRDFYLRRVARLVPALVVSIVAILVWTASTGDVTRTTLVAALSSILYAANWLAVARGWDELGLFAPMWSLAIEEQFYLLWPPTLLVLSRNLPQRWMRRILGVAAVFTFASVATQERVGVPILWMYAGSFGAAMGFLLAGCWLAFALPLNRELHRSISVVAMLSIVGAIPLVVDGYYTHRWLYRGGLALVVVAMLFVVSWSVSGRSRWLVGGRMPVLVGRLSYGIYVYHLLVASVVERFFSRLGLQPGRLAFSLIALTLSVVTAWISLHFIETPARRALVAGVRARSGHRLVRLRVTDAPEVRYRRED